MVLTAQAASQEDCGVLVTNFEERYVFGAYNIIIQLWLILDLSGYPLISLVM